MFEDIARTATVAIAATIATATGWLARSAPGLAARLTAQPEPGPQFLAGPRATRPAATPRPVGAPAVVPRVWCVEIAWIGRAPGTFAESEPGPQVAADLGPAGPRPAAGPPLAVPRPARIFRVDVA
jgi:hypothetical protein